MHAYQADVNSLFSQCRRKALGPFGTGVLVRASSSGPPVSPADWVVCVCRRMAGRGTSAFHLLQPVRGWALILALVCVHVGSPLSLHTGATRHDDGGCGRGLMERIRRDVLGRTCHWGTSLPL